MSLVVTDAILLHGFDYLESSRIFRVVTRDAGVRSVLARGARRSQRRFGTSLDLYVQGIADLQMKIGRDLDTLSAFDVVRARPQLAEQLSRFSGASVIAELTLRFASEAADTGLFDTVEWALDAIGAASPDHARDLTLCGAWRVLAELGVAPTIDQCAECRATIPPQDSPMFNHPAGGVICRRCRPLAGNGRAVPASARDVLRDWLSGVPHELASAQEGRAHQRLLHEFVIEHLSGDQPLRAFDAWEREQLTGVEASGKGAA
jgi:DNA repair protein RecO (recombination protein O)